MPLRDSEGRFCGTLQRKESDGQWDRYYFVLDEDKCLLRYFSPLNEQEKVKLDWEDYKGQINIRLITKIEDKSKNEGCIEIQTCSERYYVRADTKEGGEEWIRTLRKAAVHPTKRKDDSTAREEKSANHRTVGTDKDNTSEKTERVVYETKIIGGVAVKTPVKKNTDVDGEGGSLPGDSLIRSGSAGMTSTIKPIKEGYLTKKGAVVKSWKKRYFKLDTFRLAYYDKYNDKEPIKVINSNEVLAVKPSQSTDNNREHLFEVVTHTRTFLIQGKSEEEMHSWIDAIASALLRGRSSSEPDAKKSQEIFRKSVNYPYAETTTL